MAEELKERPKETDTGSSLEWEDPDLLPVEDIREFFNTLAKALRAYQLYDRNNPVYHRFLSNLTEAFEGIWEDRDELILSVDEDRITWFGEEVYRNSNRSDSLAFLLFRDGVRDIKFRRGLETEELEPFLEVLHRARHAQGDADDLVTLLWDRDFRHFEYEVVDLLAEGIPLPEITPTEDNDFRGILDSEGVFGEEDEDAAADAPPPSVKTQDFNPTLYALDPAERQLLAEMIRDEHDRPLRRDVLYALFDRLEEAGRPDRQAEIAEILRSLLPSFLSRGRIPSAALILDELGKLQERDLLSPDAQEVVRALLDDLAQPEVVSELVKALEDGTISTDPKELSLLLRHLRPTALAYLLAAVETTPHPTIRRVLQDAIQVIAAGAPERVMRLLGHEDDRVVSGAVRLVGMLGLPQGSAALARLLDEGPPRVQRAVVEVAGDIPSSALAGALERALDHVDRDLRIGAARALGRARYAPAAEVLQAILSSRDFREADISEKVAFFESYARLAGERGITFLDRRLNGKGLLGFKEPPEIRAAAAQGLGVVGTDAAFDALGRARDAQDPVVRSAVNRAYRGGDLE
ncbi:MAG: HEAT repeat domain-containing protein [Gemmatimonadales bacterium]|nr:MAG: HEAT repeat domain-containing protein [Gemmatimonadales bacterium]